MRVGSVSSVLGKVDARGSRSARRHTGEGHRAYKDAVAKNENDWFALNSSRDQLVLLNGLVFHPERVQAGIAVFDRALGKLKKPQGDWQPRQVILFSGHIIDAPGRQSPRFPADKEGIAAQKIGEALDALGPVPERPRARSGSGRRRPAVPRSLSAARRAMPGSAALPGPEFIQPSILPSADGDGWRDRYFAVKRRLQDSSSSWARSTQIRSGSCPTNLGRCHRVSTPSSAAISGCSTPTLSWGVDKARFICLWNGGGGDGPGGTAHMYKEVEAANRPGHMDRHAKALDRVTIAHAARHTCDETTRLTMAMKKRCTAVFHP